MLVHVLEELPRFLMGPWFVPVVPLLLSIPKLSVPMTPPGTRDIHHPRTECLCDVGWLFKLWGQWSCPRLIRGVVAGKLGVYLNLVCLKCCLFKLPSRARLRLLGLFWECPYCQKS